MKFSTTLIGKIVTASIVLVCATNLSFGQVNVSELLDKIMLNPEYAQETMVIQQMRKKNFDDKKILNFLEENYAKPRRIARMEKLKSGDPLPSKFSYHDLYLASSCNSNDIGVELGNFATWQGQTSVWGISCTSPNSGWANATLPLAGRITIVPTPATDPCATNAGFPIPLPSPSGGKYSVKLGNNQTQGQSERITHQFIVQPQDTNFIYNYAVVFQDPGHLPSEQPFFDFVILAQNGDTVPCSFQHYTAGGSIPGFQVVPSTLTACATGTSGGAVNYKPWTTVGVNLGSYVGQQVSIVCTTGDCSQCGHFGYSYLDFSCGTTSSSQFCVSSTSVVIVAPTEVGATYTWNTIPVQNTQTITVNPTVTDTVSVYVNPPSGCGYFVNYILEPTLITPAFTYTTACTTANFSNNTSITGGTISSYSWSFPGGTPSSSTSQTPPTITYLPGASYTVTLTVVSQAGCTVASTPIVITIQPPPVVNAGADVSVCGSNTVVLNGSGTPTGGTFSWSPATNLSSTTIANPTAGPYTSPTTYTLTYTNASGCKNTDVINIGIGAEPEAFASYSVTLSCEGVTASFSDSSLNATSWLWTFGDGTTSTLQDPPAHLFNYNGTYNVTLVASNGACRDTVVAPIVVGDMNTFITVTAPNVFTPNGDNLNECFKPIIGGPAVAELEKCMTMQIFDRWGIEVFESTGGANVCWDGKTKSNTKAKDGTYYYIIEMGGNTYKGYLTLLREKK